MNIATAITWTVIDLRDAAWHAWVNRLAASVLVPRVGRYLLYRLAGLRMRTPALMPGTFIQARRLSVGRTSFINYGCRFYCGGAEIGIGDHVQFGMNVTVLTDSHDIGPPGRRCGERWSKPVRIGNGCWVGANVTVLPGVTVGTGCVIAAGAVVTKSCEPHGLYAGVPARRLRDLPADTVAGPMEVATP